MWSRALKALLIPLSVVGLLAVAVPSNAEPRSGGTDEDASTASVAEDAAVDGERSWMSSLVINGQPEWKGKDVSFRTGAYKCWVRNSEYRRGLKDLRKLNAGLPPGGNWNNRISSIRVLPWCEVKLYGRAHFEGQHTRWIHKNISRLGDLPTGWNNAATSIKIRPNDDYWD